MERWTVENPAALFWDESDVCRSSRLNYAMPPVKRPARGNREYGKKTNTSPRLFYYTAENERMKSWALQYTVYILD